MNCDKIIDKLFVELFEICKEFAKNNQNLENRIEILESKPQETPLNRDRVGLTRVRSVYVQTGENESDTERLKQENAELKNEIFELRKQLITEGLL